MFKNRYLILFFIVIALFVAVAMRKDENRQIGKVIILNGPSASGKSSIQREFQKCMMPDLWIKLGIDNLFDYPLPDITLENMSVWQSKNKMRWVEKSVDGSQNPVITLFIGDEGEKVLYGMNSAIQAYAMNGCNIIVDYIGYNEKFLKDLREKLRDVKTYYVAVDISLDALESREEARGTSPRGHARSHYATVYSDIEYDLRVNSEEASAQEIAAKIKEFIELQNRSDK